MSFTFEQLVAILGIGGTLVGALWIIFTKVSARIDGINSKIEERFAILERAASGRFEKAEAARDELRKDVSVKRHDMANKMQLGLDEVNSRIDVVKDTYARREDVQALTTSMNSLSNVISRLEGMVAPLIGSLPKIQGKG